MPFLSCPDIEPATIFISLEQQRIFGCLFVLKCAILLTFSDVDGAMERFFAHIREVFEEI